MSIELAIAFVFDLLLALSLLVVAWRAVDDTRGLLESVVLFVAFGLLMALGWMRLGAPDVALAEAAIGAGVTGALFFATLARLEHILGSQRDTDS